MKELDQISLEDVQGILKNLIQNLYADQSLSNKSQLITIFNTMLSEIEDSGYNEIWKVNPGNEDESNQSLDSRTEQKTQEEEIKEINDRIDDLMDDSLLIAIEQFKEKLITTNEKNQNEINFKTLLQKAYNDVTYAPALIETVQVYLGSDINGVNEALGKELNRSLDSSINTNINEGKESLKNSSDLSEAVITNVTSNNPKITSDIPLVIPASTENAVQENKVPKEDDLKPGDENYRYVTNKNENLKQLIVDKIYPNLEINQVNTIQTAMNAAIAAIKKGNASEMKKQDLQKKRDEFNKEQDSSMKGKLAHEFMAIAQAHRVSIKPIPNIFTKQCDPIFNTNSYKKFKETVGKEIIDLLNHGVCQESCRIKIYFFTLIKLIHTDAPRPRFVNSLRPRRPGAPAQPVQFLP